MTRSRCGGERVVILGVATYFGRCFFYHFRCLFEFADIGDQDREHCRYRYRTEHYGHHHEYCYRCLHYCFLSYAYAQSHIPPVSQPVSLYMGSIHIHGQTKAARVTLLDVTRKTKRTVITQCVIGDHMTTELMILLISSAWVSTHVFLAVVVGNDGHIVVPPGSQSHSPRREMDPMSTRRTILALGSLPM